VTAVRTVRVLGVVATAVWATGPGGCAHGPVAPPPSSASRLLGEPPPAFTRPTLQGGSFTSASAAGRVLVVDFVAAYCTPCRRSLPGLQALQRRHPQLTVVGISLDDDAATARSLITRHALTFPVIHDPQRVLAGRFRVTELPASFVVDHRGRVTWAGGGDQPDGAVALAVEAALNTAASAAVPTAAASR
jgi:peroxiredoxin